jgi:hypothetical protein
MGYWACSCIPNSPFIIHISRHISGLIADCLPCHSCHCHGIPNHSTSDFQLWTRGLVDLCTRGPCGPCGPTGHTDLSRQDAPYREGIRSTENIRHTVTPPKLVLLRRGTYYGPYPKPDKSTAYPPHHILYQVYRSQLRNNKRGMVGRPLTV